MEELKSDLLILHGHSSVTRTSEEGSEQSDRLGVLVQFPDAIRIVTAPPPAEHYDVARCVLIDEQLVRDVALERAPVRSYLPCEIEALRLRARFQPGFPDHRDDHKHPPPYFANRGADFVVEQMSEAILAGRAKITSRFARALLACSTPRHRE